MPAAALISFLYVSHLDRSTDFYGGVLGFDLVVDQGDCRIFRINGSAFVGVCERPGQVSPDGHIITLVTDDVDELHEMLVSAGVTVVKRPSHRPEYRIYQAFYQDPDGHLLEVQRFDDPAWSEPL